MRCLPWSGPAARSSWWARRIPLVPSSLALEDVVRRCLTIRGLHNYAPRHLRAAIAFLAEHPEYPFATLVAGWNPLERVAEAVAKGLGRDTLRLGVRPGDRDVAGTATLL